MANPTETTFLNYLLRAVEHYLCLQGILKPNMALRVAFPVSSDQAHKFSNRNRFCFDVIAQLPNSKLLMLEAKIHRDNKFPHYNSAQNHFLQVLWRCMVPVYYAYNTCPVDRLTNLNDTLKVAFTAEPAKLIDEVGYPRYADHLCVEELVKLLLRSNDGSSAVLNPQESNYVLFDELVGNGLETLNTETLLFIYNRNGIYCFTKNDLLILIETFRQFVKNEQILVSGIEREQVTQLASRVNDVLKRSHSFLQKELAEVISGKGANPTPQKLSQKNVVRYPRQGRLSSPAPMPIPGQSSKVNPAEDGGIKL